jgi:hypothetical protein
MSPRPLAGRLLLAVVVPSLLLELLPRIGALAAAGLARSGGAR